MAQPVRDRGGASGSSSERSPQLSQSPAERTLARLPTALQDATSLPTIKPQTAPRPSVVSSLPLSLVPCVTHHPPMAQGYHLSVP